jgi:hypothetical protein
LANLTLIILFSEMLKLQTTLESIFFSFTAHRVFQPWKNAHCDRHSVFQNTPQKKIVLFPHNTCKIRWEKIITQKSMQVFRVSKALGWRLYPGTLLPQQQTMKSFLFDTNFFFPLAQIVLILWTTEKCHPYKPNWGIW